MKSIEPFVFPEAPYTNSALSLNLSSLSDSLPLSCCLDYRCLPSWWQKSKFVFHTWSLYKTHTCCWVAPTGDRPPCVCIFTGAHTVSWEVGGRGCPRREWTCSKAETRRGGREKQRGESENRTILAAYVHCCFVFPVKMKVWGKGEMISWAITTYPPHYVHQIRYSQDNPNNILIFIL